MISSVDKSVFWANFGKTFMHSVLLFSWKSGCVKSTFCATICVRSILVSGILYSSSSCIFCSSCTNNYSVWAWGWLSKCKGKEIDFCSGQCSRSFFITLVKDIVAVSWVLTGYITVGKEYRKGILSDVFVGLSKMSWLSSVTLNSCLDDSISV